MYVLKCLFVHLCKPLRQIFLCKFQCDWVQQTLDDQLVFRCNPPALGCVWENKLNWIHSDFVLFFPNAWKKCAQHTLCEIIPNAQLAKGGPCLNFAHFSMQFCNPGDPKGGPWPNAPPKYAPVYNKYQILTVSKMYKYWSREVMYLFNANRLPESSLDYSSYISSSSTCNTRGASASTIHLSQFSSDRLQHSF